MFGDYSGIFQFFYEFRELVGHGDGQGGDEITSCGVIFLLKKNYVLL